MLEIMDAELPPDRPRYLMGVGSPEDLINGVGNLNYHSTKGPVVAPLMLWGP